jgi:hypothetical protein
MTQDHFLAYLAAFEERVMIAGVKANAFKFKGDTIIPLRRKKLNGTPFADFVGDSFEHNDVLAFNYYGLVKLSSGAVKIVKENIAVFPNLRTIKSKVLHFNSVKTEHIRKLAPDLLPEFSEFKMFLVGLRDF